MQNLWLPSWLAGCLAGWLASNILIFVTTHTWEKVMLSWMHCAHLGIVVYILGEILWSLLPLMGLGRTRHKLLTRKAGQRALKARLKRFYAKSKSVSDYHGGD